MDAKLWYLQNNLKKTLEILQPYLQKNIHSVPPNIITLYVACLGDDHPVLPHIAAAIGTEKFDYLLRCRQEWRENPLRAELRSDRISSSGLLFELGGVPVSTSDRHKAGLGTEIYFDMK